MKLSHALLYIIFIVSYILLINFVSEIYTPGVSFNNYLTILDSGTQTIGLSETVSITIFRPRWWGNIEESNSKSTAYLANMIPLPIKNNGINYVKFHVIFFVLLFLLIYKKESHKTNNNTKKIDNGVNQYNKFPSPNFHASEVEISYE